MADDNILRELEDDIRRDRLHGLWKKHGGTLIGACAAVVIGTGLGVAWKNYQASENRARTGALLQAAQMQESGERREALAAVAQKGHAQGALARLRLAALAREEGNAGAALAEYRSVAGDAKQEEAVRNLARVLALHAGADAGQAAQAEALKPGAPFRAHAREALAWNAYAQGSKEEAVRHLLGVKEDAGAPAALQERAQMAAAYLAPEKAAATAPAAETEE